MLRPVKTTGFAVPTLASGPKVAVAVPVTLTTEVPSYGFPSVLLALNAAVAADCKTAVPVYVAVRLPSYGLFCAVSPLTVSALAVMSARVVGCAVSV